MDTLLLISLIFLAWACWPTEKSRAEKRSREAARRARAVEEYELSRLRYKPEAWIKELALPDPDNHTFEEIKAWLFKYNNFYLTDRYKAYLIREKGLQFKKSDLLDYVRDLSEAQFELHTQ